MVRFVAPETIGSRSMIEHPADRARFISNALAECAYTVVLLAVPRRYQRFCEPVPAEHLRGTFTGMLSSFLDLAPHLERVPPLPALDVPRPAAVAEELLCELATWNSEAEPSSGVVSLARWLLTSLGMDEPLAGWDGFVRPASFG